LGRNLPRRARSLFRPGDWRHRHAGDPDAGDRHHHADDRRRYRRCRLLHLGRDALHDRRNRGRLIDRGGVVEVRPAQGLCPRRRRIRGQHGGLRARPQHWRADRGARRPRLGRRVGCRQRHGTDHQPVRRAAAHPDHCDFSRHLHRMSLERADRRGLVRGDELVARLVLDDGALHAALHLARLFENPRPARHRSRAPSVSWLAGCFGWLPSPPECSASPPVGR
jgi:hypothetical protein